MKNYLFPIVGLRYHDFKDRLEELYGTAVGKTISLDVEEDNRAEANAVAAYMGTLRVGYVRTDMRALACGVAHDCDDDLPMGVVERVDAENRVIWVSFDVDDEVAPEPNTMPNVLTNWHYEGAKLLPYPEVMKGLNVCTMSLKTVLKRNPDRWTEEMESWLCCFEQCFAYDISGKASDDRARILEMLTALTPKDAAFGRAAARMEYAIREMASVESSQCQAQMVRDMAVSDEMDKLLTRLHDDAATTAAQLPQVLRDEMKNNLSLLLTRVFYWRVPKMKLQDVLSLMALNLRLEMDGEKNDITELISDDLIDWTQGDEEKVDIVKDIAIHKLIKTANPRLVSQFYNIEESCRKHFNPHSNQVAATPMPATGTATNWSEHPLYPYITDKSQAPTLLGWLDHEMITLSKPKDKLRVIRALEEGNYFNSKIPCNDYGRAYGEIKKNTYSYWMTPSKDSEASEIDAILSTVSALFV